MQYKTKVDLDRSINELKKLSRTFSRQYLYTNESRANFSLEIDQLIQFAKRDISIHCTSYAGAISIIEEEINNLKQQEFNINTGKAKLFVAIKKEKRERFSNLVMKQVGFVSGGSQIFAGIGTCALSAGMACGGVGVPLMAQGANNVYESGYYLLFRKDKVGSIREAYHYAANYLGYNKNEADIVYSSVDISLSGYGIFSKSLRPDSWRLFKHINSDYIIEWKKLGTVPLGTEVFSNAITGYGIYKLIDEETKQ
ncbi:DUF4225 domain-containing protein [Serratia marcescens]|uniref:DUF4225 domain-containing protein n=1 Tax=Serratia marcescens TaxID=615 RepID=A0AAP8TQ40_SERMA|nr:DUF4225 domain-containing protein [Serratia marcescens]PNO69904.1 DUF4225 domain-containing protein [Serratia marcescens]RNW03780.1 DUF4225 domain-containing protein [Serratia nematodiphila]